MNQNENIDGLPAGRDLDALIAREVMGISCLIIDGEIINDDVSKLFNNGPHYSTDLLDAYKIIEKFNYQVTIQGPKSVDFNEGEEYPDCWTVGFGHDAWRVEKQGTAQTLMLAICYASLKTPY